MEVLDFRLGVVNIFCLIVYFIICIDIVLFIFRSERVKSLNYGGGMIVWGGCEEVCVDGCFDIYVNFFFYVLKGIFIENWEKGLR